MSVLRRSRTQLFCVGAFVLFQVYFYLRYQNGSLSSSDVFIDDGSTYISGPYQRLIQANSGDGFRKSSYSDTCKSYFDLLYTEDAMWRSTDYIELPYTRYIFDSEPQFVKDSINNWKKALDEKKPESEKIPDRVKDEMAREQNMEAYFKKLYREKVEETKDTENKLVDSATHLRVYGACFLDQFGYFNKDEATKESRCHDIERRMFLWLGRRFPIYTRWDGTTVKSGMPVMSDYTENHELEGEEGEVFMKSDPSQCFMKYLRDSYNGKGIVVSAAENHVEQVISLIALLRATRNRLPIQVVHSGDMSELGMNMLIHAARNTKKLNLAGIEKINDILRKRGITYSAREEIPEEEIEKLFPPQELWFVDVTRAVAPEHCAKFSGYANKLLAYFFSSFRHTILVDTDTVPVADLDQWVLQTPFYKEHAAYFFKDREIHYQNRGSDVHFFKKFMPSKIDTAIFGIPAVTEHTMGNRFFKLRFQHFMESGVVGIDKKRHFTGVLGALQIQMWSPGAAITWGDKELFWLGMSMTGDEDYYMNHWPAGAAGFITPKDIRFRFDKDDVRKNNVIGNQLCSTHPSHISAADNSTLVWYNSGVSYCKKPNAYKTDWSRDMFRGIFSKQKDLQDFYSHYHHIEAVIVPKGAEFYRKSNSGENERGWVQVKECQGFMFCAFDKVGGVDDPESNGLLVEFDEETKALYNFYGSTAELAPRVFGLV